MEDNKNPIIVALDGLTSAAALEMAALLSGKVWGFKITDLLFESTEIISKLKNFGQVFADAKLHDIPKTVAGEVKKLSAAGSDLITVHAAGGSKILAVTVLTSLDENLAKDIFNKNVKDLVLSFAEEIKRASLDGLVCSGHELLSLKDINGLIRVVPGIRPSWFSEADDQKR